ncbi:hypothetical protein, partial [Streptomyces formicae]
TVFFTVPGDGISGAEAAAVRPMETALVAGVGLLALTLLATFLLPRPGRIQQQVSQKPAV